MIDKLRIEIIVHRHELVHQAFFFYPPSLSLVNVNVLIIVIAEITALPIIAFVPSLKTHPEIPLKD